MGNAFPGTGGAGATSRYYSSKEAMGILGDETWVRLRKQLEWHAKNGRYVDYALFSRILYRRYERMVSDVACGVRRATVHVTLSSSPLCTHPAEDAVREPVPGVCVGRGRVG